MTATTFATDQYRELSVTLAKLNGDVTLDAINAPVASLSLNSQLITDLLDPVGPQDAATQNSVDTAIAAALTSALIYQGVIDCSANPNYPAATRGWVYVISVAGKIGGASGAIVEAGDTVICNTTNAGGDQATVGADFNIVQGNTNGVVIGPASAVSGNLPSFNGTSGKSIQDSGVAAASVVVGPASAVSGNISTYNGTTGKSVQDSGFSVSNAAIDTSTTRAPTSGSVKAYVDAEVAGVIVPASVLGEIPTGLIDSSNTSYAIANTPTGGVISLFRNGVLQLVGGGNDYTFTGTTITMLAAPLTGDSLQVNYNY